MGCQFSMRLHKKMCMPKGKNRDPQGVRASGAFLDPQLLLYDHVVLRALQSVTSRLCSSVITGSPPRTMGVKQPTKLKSCRPCIGGCKEWCTRRTSSPSPPPKGSRFLRFDIQILRNVAVSGVGASPRPRGPTVLRFILDPPLP